MPTEKDFSKWSLDDFDIELNRLCKLINQGLLLVEQDQLQEFFIFEKASALRAFMSMCEKFNSHMLAMIEEELNKPSKNRDDYWATLSHLHKTYFQLKNLLSKEALQSDLAKGEAEVELAKTIQPAEGPKVVPLQVVEPATETQPETAEAQEEPTTDRVEGSEATCRTTDEMPKGGRWVELVRNVLGRDPDRADINRIYGAVGKPYLVLEDTVEDILKGLEGYGEIPTSGQLKLLADVAQTLKGLGSTESIDFIWLAETMKNQLTEGLSLKATLDALVKLYAEKHPVKGKEYRKEQSSGSKRINLKRLGEKGFDDDAVQEVTNALGGYVISTKPMGFLVGFARKYKQTLTQAAELMMKIDPELKLDFISLDEQMAGLLKQIKRHTANPTSQGEGGRSKV